TRELDAALPGAEEGVRPVQGLEIVGSNLAKHRKTCVICRRAHDKGLLWIEDGTSSIVARAGAIVRAVDAKRTGPIARPSRGAALKTEAAWAWCQPESATRARRFGKPGVR